MKQVLTGEKRLLKKNEVNYIHVPGYEELSASRLWGDLKDDKTFNIYFQDNYANQKAPCRDYFFNMLNTVYPEYLKRSWTTQIRRGTLLMGSNSRSRLSR